MRTRFVLLTTAVIAVVNLLVGTYLEAELRGSLEKSLRTELERHANSAARLLEASPDPLDPVQADRVADLAGEATSARVTIVRKDGEVIGDSEIPVQELSLLESHATRPEIRQALALGRGASTRYSTTLEQAMLYVAEPTYLGPDRTMVVVRAALSMDRMRAAIWGMRRAVALTGLFSLVIGGLLMAFASRLLAESLRSVMSAAQAMAGARGRVGEESTGRSLSQMTEELERALAMLATERNRFEAVLQTMEQAVIALDARHRVTTVNQAGRKLLGLSREVEGLTLREAIRIPALNELVEEASGGRRFESEFDVPGGRRVEAKATAQSDGGVVLVVHDVTTVRRLERVRRDFVANVSHELRTPISVIRANTETLLAGALEDKNRSREFIEAVLRHAERLGRIVSDLLDISRIEAGRYPLVPEAVSVVEVTDRVLDSVEGAAHDKEIELVVNVDEDVEVWADRKALEHVLINLVGNAVKYTPEGGCVEVRTRAGDEPGDVRVEVVDNGPGIDPGHRKRIFERFYRVDPGRSREMGGTGLGLSIVKHLVEAMEGAVGVDPRSPQGSTFWFTLRAPQSRSGADFVRETA